MFNNELAGTPIEEFCKLKPKLYSLVAGGYGKMSAKGTKKFAQSRLHHDMFKKTSEKHQLRTVSVKKIALSAYDDKRYMNGDRTTALPIGHFFLRDEYLTKQICEDSYRGFESDEDINIFNIHEGGDASGWETPDPGFNAHTRMRS